MIPGIMITVQSRLMFVFGSGTDYQLTPRAADPSGGQCAPPICPTDSPSRRQGTAPPPPPPPPSASITRKRKIEKEEKDSAEREGRKTRTDQHHGAGAGVPMVFGKQYLRAVDHSAPDGR